MMRTIRLTVFAAVLLTLTFVGTMVLIVPPQVLTPSGEIPHHTPSNVGLPFEEVFFTPKDQNIKLSGWWIPAKNAENVLIYVHGAGGNKEAKFSNGLALYRELVRQRISVLALDLRNHGNSSASASGQMRLGLTEKNDVIAALDFLETKGNRLPVYLLGNSMGGATAIYTAAEDKRITGLILLDPLLDTISTSINFVNAATGLPKWAANLSIWSAINLFDMSTQNSNDTLAKLKLPILVLLDEADPVAEPHHALKTAKRRNNIKVWIAKNPDKKIYKELNLGGFGTHSAAPRLYLNQTVQEIVTFIK